MRVTVVEGTVDEVRAAFPDLVSAADTVTARPVQHGVAAPTDPAGAGQSPEDGELRAWLASRRNPKVAAPVEALIDGLIEDGFLPDLGRSKNTQDGKVDYLRFYPQGPRRVGALAYVYPRTGRVDLRAPDTSFQDANPQWPQFVDVNAVAAASPYKACVRVVSPHSGEVARAIVNHLRDLDVAPVS